MASNLSESIVLLQNQMNLVRDQFQIVVEHFEAEKQQHDADKASFLKEKKVFDRERSKYENELQQMKKFEVCDNDIIYLNVGGEKMCTLRSTLIQTPNTVLAMQFSGKWEEKILKNKDGHVFLDYDPQLFRLLLNQLREWNGKQLVHGKDKIIFDMPLGLEVQFTKLIRQLGFEQEQITLEKFSKIFGGVKIEDDGKSVIHDGNGSSHSEIRGEKLYSYGIHRVQLKIEKMRSNYWIFIGIISSTQTQMQLDSFHSPTAYGWAASKLCVYLNGQRHDDSYESYDGDLCEQDTVDLVINCDKGKIQLLNRRTSKSYEIQIDANYCPKPWQLHLNLYYIDDKVRLLS
ncbi:unnamed protein product [Didymodactylos carnosus]|uniref:Potassium channel tetramerisation-type BTB domain-containing protein n=1 Tax=Didymodactylos carnosus TaxID=1234261 RepID=A0A814W0W2_9BILA|nr:unnamed protein product [Didymodactylos carnosus]CAF1196115.1 unnamed protein product [Didymodactylos carnosus]CAF3864209.1 unnamed protein product [Didymodactylos carnosus]CAF3960485.1 unnamed protein product [Didymodactylos carnosus]